MKHPEDAVTEKERKVFNGVRANCGIGHRVSLHLPGSQSENPLNAQDRPLKAEIGELDQVLNARHVSSPDRDPRPRKTIYCELSQEVAISSSDDFCYKPEPTIHRE